MGIDVTGFTLTNKDRVRVEFSNAILDQKPTVYVVMRGESIITGWDYLEDVFLNGSVTHGGATLNNIILTRQEMDFLRDEVEPIWSLWRMYGEHAFQIICSRRLLKNLREHDVNAKASRITD